MNVYCPNPRCLASDKSRPFHMIQSKVETNKWVCNFCGTIITGNADKLEGTEEGISE